LIRIATELARADAARPRAEIVKRTKKKKKKNNQGETVRATPDQLGLAFTKERLAKSLSARGGAPEYSEAQFLADLERTRGNSWRPA
jgi:hypothetical protein